jgi:hypothetical protein
VFKLTTSLISEKIIEMSIVGLREAKAETEEGIAASDLNTNTARLFSLLLDIHCKTDNKKSASSSQKSK